jgi:hypothetical protein
VRGTLTPVHPAAASPASRSDAALLTAKTATGSARDHSEISFAPSFWLRGEGKMRAYLTAAGMALGLVAVWAAPAPLLA